MNRGTDPPGPPLRLARHLAWLASPTGIMAGAPRRQLSTLPPGPLLTDPKQWKLPQPVWMNSEVHFLKPSVFLSRSIQIYPGTKDFPMLGTRIMSGLLWQLVSGSLYLIQTWCVKVYCVFRKPNTLQIWNFERGKWRGTSFHYRRLLVLGSGAHSVISSAQSPLPCRLRNLSVALRKNVQGLHQSLFTEDWISSPFPGTFLVLFCMK